jgi:hypothetical protein
MTDPGEGSLDDPPFGQDDEAMQLVALDDLPRPGAGLGDGDSSFGPLVPASGKMPSINGNRRRVRRSRTSEAPQQHFGLALRRLSVTFRPVMLFLLK